MCGPGVLMARKAMMISETGNSRKLSSKKAFTIIEVLLVLGLIAITAGLFAVNFDVLLRNLNEKNPEKILHEVLRQARYHAIYNHSIVRVAYNEDTSTFLLARPNGEVIQSIKDKNETDYIFYLKPPEVLARGGFIPQKKEDTPLNHLEFYPDQSNTPAWVELQLNNEKILLEVDPLSCGLRLAKES